MKASIQVIICGSGGKTQRGSTAPKQMGGESLCYVRFQVSVMVQLRSSLFWDIMQCWLVVTDILGWPISPIFIGQAVQEIHLTFEDRTNVITAHKSRSWCDAICAFRYIFYCLNEMNLQNSVAQLRCLLAVPRTAGSSPCGLINAALYTT